MDLLNCDNDIPYLAKWKALLLKHGVDLNNLDDFTNFKGIDSFKTKYSKLQPKSIDHEVYNDSKDDNLIPSEIILTDNKYNRSIVKLRYSNQSPLPT